MNIALLTLAWPSDCLLTLPCLGVILSGGPYSVYEKGSPHVDPKVWDLKVPVLGICYGLQVSVSECLPSNQLS